jgi:hypothetical protein
MVGHTFLPSSRFYSGTGLPAYWAGFAKYNIAKSSLEAFVGFRDAMKKFFGTSGNATPPDATRLSATSENSLGSSLQKLPSGERGWITMTQAAALFSNEKEQYGFGEFDEDGKTKLAQFASQYRSMPDFRPSHAVWCLSTGSSLASL